MLAVKVRITDEDVTDAHGGQMDANIKAYDIGTGKLAGYVDYAVYQGRPHINFIEVGPQYRGSGIAQQLIDKLAAQYGYKKIEWGMTTPEGTKLKAAMDRRYSSSMAHERDPPSKDTIAGSEITWRAFLAYLRGLVGDSFDKLDLQTIRENYGDYTIEGAKEKADRDEGIQKYVLASTVVDELEEDPANAMVKEVIEQLKGFGYSDQKIANIIRGSGIDIERPTSEGMGRLQKQLEAEKNRAEDLERQLAEAKAPRTPEGKPYRPRGVQPIYNEDQEKLFLNYFNVELEKRLKREANAQELNRFNEFIDMIQKVKPPLKAAQVKNQVEDIAQALAALERGKAVPAQREKRRTQDLLDRMLEGPVTPEEEEELMRLTGKLESEENYGLSTMEPDYPRPNIRLIAESGPETKYLLGTPLKMGETFPRELMRTWDRDNAEANKANYEAKGYTVRIEEF